MSKEDFFRGCIRFVFLSAYGAFLWASIHHVAAFFHSFEEDPANWTTPYWLAGSIDITALVLTIGMMFFRRGMPWWAQTLTWGFIISLTGFSWFVNWEYAILHMSPQLANNPRLSWLRDVNPIMASAFAFLNLAYSLVAEFFSAKKKTLSEIQAEIDERELLEASKTELADIKSAEKIASIKRVKALGRAIKGDGKSVETPVETVSIPPSVLPQSMPSIEDEIEEETEEELPPILEQEIAKPDTKEAPIPVLLPEYEEVVKRYQKIEAPLRAGAKSLSISQVKEIATCQERVLLKLIENGVLKQTKRNKELLTMESVLAWLSSRKVPTKIAQNSVAKITQNGNGNGHHDTMISAAELVPLILQ